APKIEATVSQSAPAMPSPTPAPPQPPPRLAEVREKVAGIYQQSVTVYPQGDGCLAITGDFNGDSSQDLAVVVRPAAGKLDRINSELANWIIRDPHSVKPPSSRHMSIRLSSGRVKVAQGDLLLAVIHGYGAAGWRNPSARQSYLLRNVVGQDMQLQ